MIIKCPKCGNLVSDQGTFCSRCGARLTTPVDTNVSGVCNDLRVDNKAKKSKINMILLCVITVVVLAVLGVSGYLVFADRDDSRGIPKEYDTYNNSSLYGYGNENLVYCDSYDGYLSIRATASSKGEVIGRFRNGPRGAIKLGETGDWVEIEYDGLVGYVKKTYVSYSPTKEVTVDVDEKWLIGAWYPSHGEYAYLIFNNGTYTVQYEYGTIAYGTYRLEGDEIIFNATMLRSNHSYDIGSYERHRVTVSPKRMGPLTKRSLVKESDLWKHYGELVWTWAQYSELKKQTKENVN